MTKKEVIEQLVKSLSNGECPDRMKLAISEAIVLLSDSKENETVPVYPWPYPVYPWYTTPYTTPYQTTDKIYITC